MLRKNILLASVAIATLVASHAKAMENDGLNPQGNCHPKVRVALIGNMNLNNEADLANISINFGKNYINGVEQNGPCIGNMTVGGMPVQNPDALYTAARAKYSNNNNYNYQNNVYKTEAELEEENVKLVEKSIRKEEKKKKKLEKKEKRKVAKVIYGRDYANDPNYAPIKLLNNPQDNNQVNKTNSSNQFANNSYNVNQNNSYNDGNSTTVTYPHKPGQNIYGSGFKNITIAGGIITADGVQGVDPANASVPLQMGPGSVFNFSGANIVVDQNGTTVTRSGPPMTINGRPVYFNNNK